MVKRNISLVSSIIFALSIGYSSLSFAVKTFFRGSIQFPETMSSFPNIRVYSGGFKIKTETTTQGLSFEIPEEKHRKRFSIIVTENVQFEVEPGTNTIKYLKIKKGQPYKMFSASLIKNEEEQPFEFKSRNEKKPITPKYEWLIEEQDYELVDGRIPDDAVIVCFNPSYVDRLEGGNTLELPAIVMKKNIVQLAGSEDNLQNASIKLLLSSLDTDAIHANIQQEIRQENQKTRITMIAA